MTATMMNMELRFADYLLPNQMAEGDLIKIDDTFLTIKTITEINGGYDLILLDDFDDEVEAFIGDDDKVEWYVFVE
jgi:hypothetical protein